MELNLYIYRSASRRCLFAIMANSPIRAQWYVGQVYARDGGIRDFAFIQRLDAEGQGFVMTEGKLDRTEMQ